LGGIASEREGFLARELQHGAVTQRVGHVKAQLTGLAGAEKFTGTAKLQIGFGNFEAVVGAHHGFQAGAALVGKARRGDENAVRLMRATADATAKLVQLSEAETLGMLDDHDGGVGHVNANFDDRGGNKDLQVIAAESLHDVVFFLAGEAPVQETDFQLREDECGETFIFLDRGFQLELRLFDDGINDIGLMARFDLATQKFPDAFQV